MSKRIRMHLRNNVVGYVAVFLATSGVAVASHPGGANTISTGDIINGEVFTQDIANNNLTSLDIRDDTLAFGGLDAIDLRANSVGGSEIQSNAVSSAELNANSVGQEEINAAGAFVETGRGSDAIPIAVGLASATTVASEPVNTADDNIILWVGKVAIDNNTASLQTVGCRIIDTDGSTVIDEVEPAFGGSITAPAEGADDKVLSLTGTSVASSGSVTLRCWDSGGSNGETSAYDGVLTGIAVPNGELSSTVLSPASANSAKETDREETAPAKSKEGGVE